VLKRLSQIVVVLLVFAGSSFAQNTTPVISVSDSVVKHMGQDYYWHLVEQGETLFSISKAYKVFLSQVVFANPGVMDGLEPGQGLLIPKEGVAPAKVVAPPTPVDGNHILYTVPPKMTLYSISKEYEVTMDQLVTANPELKDGLKNGMVLRIPIKGILEEAGSDQIQLTGIPELIAAVKKDTGDPFQILLFAPFFLDENDTLVLHEKAGREEKTFTRSSVAIQFYEGLLLALDSLTRRGLRFDLKVIDTERSITKVERYLNNRSLKRPDVIIGPFYRQLLKPVARFAYQNCIPVISPTARDLASIGYNDYLVRTNPNSRLTDQNLGTFIAKRNRNENFILVHYGRPEEQQLQIDFRKGLESLGTDSLPNLEVIDLEEGTYADLKAVLKKDVPNHIIVLTNNEASVSKLMRSTMSWLEDFEIILYSGESWSKFKNIDVAYFDQLRHHRPDVTFVNYEDDLVVDFNLKFREFFGTEPGTFAFKGYDLGIQLLARFGAIQKEGIQVISDLSHSKGLQQKFHWIQNSKGHWVNRSSYILRLNDLSLEIAD
jgi:LysM repeat protein